MKRLKTLLLCILMSAAIIASASVAFAQDMAGFAQMTPQEQYEYLMTLENDADVQAALNLLSEEQLAALKEYERAQQTPAAENAQTDDTEEPVNTPPQPGGDVADDDISDEDIPGEDMAEASDGAADFAQMTPGQQFDYLAMLESDEERQAALNLLSENQMAALKAYELEQQADTSAETADQPEEPADTSQQPGDDQPEAPNGAVDFAQMTMQQQYDYLSALETEEEIFAALSLLTDDQMTALEQYELSLEPDKSARGSLAVNQTHAGPFKDPVEIPAMLMAKSFDMHPMDANPEEDALMLDKWVSGSDGHYTLNIEAYATGEVSIVTGETPVPADIILVLDVSGSMEDDIISGYTSLTFNTNREANNFENDHDLFVLIDGQYCMVTISRSGGIYTYEYTIDGQTIQYPNGTGNDSPPDWEFYRSETIERIEALQAAANSFINSVEDKANSLPSGVDHRIAIVSFASGSSIVSGNHTAGGAFVSAYNNASGIDTLQSAINGLSANGATRADLGMENAVNIFGASPTPAGLRNRVVVFFTDGSPTSSSSFSEWVANGAISHAKTLKKDIEASGYGATVYSIGIFDGADPTADVDSSSTAPENKFMHFVSSNYPNAQSMTNHGSGSNDGYYLSASNTSGLNDIFESISENIETGGTTVTLDESSVIKDLMTPYFSLPAGADEDDVLLLTSTADPVTGTWQTPAAFTDGSVDISADGKTVSVSGFDYSDNYYAAIETNGEITGYQGKKLIIQIPIDYIVGSCFGGTVPTNEAPSGIYDDNIRVEALPIPYVDIPVNYDFTALNTAIYLTQSADISDFFAEAAGYIPNGVNNAYVNIVYTVSALDSTALGTYTVPAGETSGSWNTGGLTIEGLTANTGYTVSCTVTPVSGPVSAQIINKPVTVYVWKPEITFCDSTIYLGETADYSNNLVSAIWENISVTAPVPTCPVPVLLYTYAPAADKFEEDTHVGVGVKIGTIDVTGHVAFVHEQCGFPNCGFDPDLGQFMVHVKPCCLTITKTGAADTTDTFVFTVSGDNGLTLRLSMQGNGSRTIVGLPIGSYTVTEESDWSWRYTAASQSVTLSRAQDCGDVQIVNQVTNDKWLSGDSWAANYFLGAD